MRPIQSTLCVLALAACPVAGLAEPATSAPPLEPGLTCSAADERFLPRIPVQIVVRPQDLERHQRDEYVVLRNDGTTYEEPVFVDTSETVAPPPLR